MTRIPIGSAVRRTEDDALLRGACRYIDDIAGDALRATFVRSPIAHARIGAIDVHAASNAPGVVAVFTADDLGLGMLKAHRMLPDTFDRRPLATDVVRHVGDPIAVVVAATREQALDAAELVEVDLAPLPIVAHVDDALAPGASPLFPANGSNRVATGERESEAVVLDGADIVVRGRFVNQRVSTAPMEPDGALAAPAAHGGRTGVTVWASTQRVHHVRNELAHCLGLDPDLVRVVAPQVGGGFGGKFEAAPEAAVVAAAALRLGRPVAWTQTRTENLLGMPHGRGQIQQAALGVRRDGTFTGIWAELTGDAGAYPTTGSLVPGASLGMIPGTYRIAKAGGRNGSATTNTTPVGAYRGAGRPEACALVERLVELAAHELGMDPLELRRRNLVPRDAFPYRSATGMTYDSGDYRGCLDAAAELIGYDDIRVEQARRRAAGSTLALGVAVTMWIDCTPMNRPGEWAAVDVRPHPVDPDGIEVSVRDGANDQGQAHRTTWGILLSHTLGVPLERVHLALGDTAQVPHGEGTGSARSLMLAGGAVAEAGARILEQAQAVAAHLLEAAPADIALTDDARLGVVGSPQRSVSWGRVARAAADPAALPPDVAALLGPHGLGAEVDFTQPGPTFPSGAHAALVEVDLDTGKATLLRFVAVDDCGTVINPVVVAGQQHGGIVQGIGQALYEEIVFDGDGNLRTANFADYLVPSAADVPAIDAHTRPLPSPVNPLGTKGIGQAGAIGATPAVQNAVIDALVHLGVRHVDLPLSPERLWRAVRDAQAASPSV